jgi:hypothetical protein
MRWLEYTENDLLEMKVKRRGQKAQNRKEVYLLNEARVLRGR